VAQRHGPDRSTTTSDAASRGASAPTSIPMPCGALLLNLALRSSADKRAGASLVAGALTHRTPASRAKQSSLTSGSQQGWSREPPFAALPGCLFPSRRPLHPVGHLGYAASVPADPSSRPRLDRTLRPYPTRTISNAAAFGSMSSDSADPLAPLGAGRRHGSSGSP
jgi:hypothetical protein